MKTYGQGLIFKGFDLPEKTKVSMDKTLINSNLVLDNYSGEVNLKITGECNLSINGSYNLELNLVNEKNSVLCINYSGQGKVLKRVSNKGNLIVNEKISGNLDLNEDTENYYLYENSSKINDGLTHLNVNVKNMVEGSITKLFNKTFLENGSHVQCIKIKVDKPGCQVHQNSKILHCGGEISALPILDITQDDVQASHGVAIEQIDKNLVFYLASRGVKFPEKLIVESFLE